MLPKDLLVDLETGDRTKDHLERKEIANETYNTLNVWANQMAVYQQGLQQQQFAGAHTHSIGGLGQLRSGQLGGFIQW